MSKSAKAYGAAGLVLIAFPLFLSLWSGQAALLAILMMGIGIYAGAVCLLVVGVWYRHRHGKWPIELPEEYEPDPQYQPWGGAP